MNRIDQLFSEKKRQGRKTLVMFVSAGDPDLDTTRRLVRTIADAGADIIEIGVPFSDPTADGPTIQAASQRALAAGTTLPGILRMVSELRREINTPLILFGYYNQFFHYGVDALAGDAAEAGVDGMLIVDLPFEEAAEVTPALTEHNLYLIPLLAPTTSAERTHRILRHAAGFIYYICVTGVTGIRSEVPADLAEHLAQIASVSEVPTVAGFGVSTPAMAYQVAQHADGVVVGSALVNIMAQAASGEEGVQQAHDFVKSLAQAVARA